ncbi:hypothetical protein QN372_01870 [Undibacterium sp. RTI2.1]|uniref:hypothetical protein n=1 Tax=unclassified Undibacterium TaxID=2630295 RepID=UPI002AB4F0C0|nr:MULTISPECIES: hypothetical protein [unclassified Undibacterium]MDY7536849.1 hypothetical protein [Undibacterium sp. 5I1]MEB0029486.1 hypothetical protein [Undibacterium sp. RTI2.1]MEB0115672.1 hypothetical protein [Undibacterium sp. RTI2.2]MEB0232005.1 hypothetical protein [Undibacterium sp. 10I3]MEB0256731.1 hypothetical protein [Undibacterium sp. 5I1]
MFDKDTRDAYIEKMKQQLDELNVTMQELEVKAKEAREDAHDKYNEEMTKLREQSHLANEKLNELKAAGEESWKDLVVGTEKVRDAFIKTFHDFKSKL